MSKDPSILESYSIQVGKDFYEFKNIELTQKVTGGFGLTLGTYKSLAKKVCEQILSKEKNLSYDELEFCSEYLDYSIYDVLALLNFRASEAALIKSGQSSITTEELKELKKILTACIKSYKL